MGDEVVTRRNNRTLRTDQGFMVKNRDHWTITDIHRNGGITVKGRTGTIRLPVEYVTEDVELGYAQTSHASQGRTLDTALLLVDNSTDSRGVYTPMTRGRQANHAYVVTDSNQTGLDVLAQALAREWVDQPAVARRLELNRDRQLQFEPPLPGEASTVARGSTDPPGSAMRADPFGIIGIDRGEGGAMAASFVALWSKPTDVEGFERHYKEVHLPMVNQWPGLVAATAVKATDNPLGGEPSYHLVFQARFESAGALEKLLSSDQFGEALADAQEMMSRYGTQVEVLTASAL